MNNNDLQRAYFDWMYHLAIRETGELSYRELLSFLNETPFRPPMPMDENRAQDGEDLRYRFGYEFRYMDPEIGPLLDCRPCSMLEMMLALSLRIESIMKSPTLGDRTSYWFLLMLRSLGLSGMSDGYFDAAKAAEIVHRFSNRLYAQNGRGGLFTISSRKHDMRNAEIWYQMNWFLDDILLSTSERKI